VGQPVVVRTISNAFQSGRLHQSYLFVGQFGSGKTTTARIVAAMENCEVSPGMTPCGTCSICARIFEGDHEDVKEIDAASGAGKVDQIRELVSDLINAPIDGAKKRYYIVDECHRMSGASGDAFLKAIEEPPDHFRFIFCTTDPNKLAPTIHSRCQRHDFRKILWTEIAERLEVVAKAEGFQYEQGAAFLCARMASGSLRNGLQNLEKLVDFAGSQPASLAHAEQMFGTAGEKVYHDLIDQAIGLENGRPDGTVGFRILNQILREGSSPEIIYETLSTHLDYLLIGLTASQAYEFASLSEEGTKRLQRQIVHLKGKHESVLDSIEILYRTKGHLEFNFDPEKALRLWFIRTVIRMRNPQAAG
jgi:DNA polymerase-3 subunit gamma/tau